MVSVSMNIVNKKRSLKKNEKLYIMNYVPSSINSVHEKPRSDILALSDEK